ATTTDPPRRAWLLEVARRADLHSVRNRFRDPKAWSSGAALRRLAQEAGQAEGSPPPLVALGWGVREVGGDALLLLKWAQARHPQDFWLNFDLALTLVDKKAPGEAVGFCWAALILRPRTAAVYNNLGAALHAQGDLNGAIASYRQALECAPNYGPALTNLGAALPGRGDLKSATAHHSQAVNAEP